MQISYLYLRTLKWTFYLVWNWTCFYLLSGQCQINKKIGVTKGSLQLWAVNRFQNLLPFPGDCFLWELVNKRKINKVRDRRNWAYRWFAFSTVFAKHVWHPYHSLFSQPWGGERFRSSSASGRGTGWGQWLEDAQLTSSLVSGLLILRLKP